MRLGRTYTEAVSYPVKIGTGYEAKVGEYVELLYSISCVSVSLLCPLSCLFPPLPFPILFLLPPPPLSPPASLLLQDFAVPGFSIGCIVCPGSAVPRAAQQILFYYATSSFAQVGVACGCGHTSARHASSFRCPLSLCYGPQHLMTAMIKDTGGCAARQHTGRRSERL